MNPIIFDLPNQEIKNLPEKASFRVSVSPESLRAAECLLSKDEGCFAQKRKLILAEILDEIDFSSLVKARLDRIGNRAVINPIALQKLERDARSMGWL